MFRFPLTPEGTLLSAVETFFWRRDGEVQNAVSAPIGSVEDQLMSFVAAVMRVKHPQYLDFGEALLRKVVRIGAAWTVQTIAYTYRNPYPRQDWWKEQVTLADAARGSLPAPFEGISLAAFENSPTRTGTEWRSLCARARDSDELFMFRSPADYWAQLGGRAGLVLVRRGAPISHVTLSMN